LVVNPARRPLENALRRQRALLNQVRARLAATAYPSEGTAAPIAEFEKERGQCMEEVRQHEEASSDL
jgi:hypothetical protein